MPCNGSLLVNYHAIRCSPTVITVSLKIVLSQPKSHSRAEHLESFDESIFKNRALARDVLEISASLPSGMCAANT